MALESPSTWAKLQKEWILSIVCIAYFHRICVLLPCMWFPCFLDVRVQCLLVLSLTEREMEILGHILYLFYTLYARGELGLRTQQAFWFLLLCCARYNVLLWLPCWSRGWKSGEVHWRLDLDLCLRGIQNPRETFFRAATYWSHKPSVCPAWPHMTSKCLSTTN